MSDRNMYGCTPCPKCNSKYCYPIKENNVFMIVCDTCNYDVKGEKDGKESWKWNRVKCT